MGKKQIWYQTFLSKLDLVISGLSEKYIENVTMDYVLKFNGINEKGKVKKGGLV